ncbi:MAG: hypothetical protein M1812_003117 [Candelaria pacifica]|nr:MAG: hypothetical protein M1812_003117 [Candelaria pacifica]
MAPSKPSLRSSSRQAAAVTDPLATASENIDPPTTRGTKRARENTTGNEDIKIAKKPRLRAQANPRAKAAAPKRAAKTAALPPNKPPTKIIVSEPGSISRTTNGVRATLDEPTNSSQRPKDETSCVNGEAKSTDKGKKPAQSDKRTLRSQNGGSRSKSELALYFPNYEEMISNEPKQAEYLTAETSILVIDDAPKSSKPSPSKSGPIQSSLSPTKTRSVSTNTQSNQALAPAPTHSPENSSPKLKDFQKIDFSSIERNAGHTNEDPLTDSVYQKAHRRAERQEKQLRNIEKERAQHEKVQLERLLDGLKGHDWLRIMGISGITESSKKEYEPKRDLFIKEVGTLVEKFRIWKEEEKRRKVAKTQGQQPPTTTVNESQTLKPGDTDRPSSVADSLSDGDPPDYNDVDAWAARQLHQEAVSATSPQPPSQNNPNLTSITTKPIKPQPPSPPFTSFYSKPYLRAAAIGNHRRGRSKTAFGKPLPDLVDCDFELPLEILDDGNLTREIRVGLRKSRQHGKGDDGNEMGRGEGT